MINISTIYKITNPKGKVYIGQTNNIERRHSGYARGDCKSQKLLYNSIRKYGWEAHKVEKVFEGTCSGACLNRLEVFFIDHYRSYSTGLNLTKGGGGARGYKPSEETKAKQSAAKKGKPLPHLNTPEVRARISAAHKGKELSQETRARLSEAHKGKKLSPEHIAKRVATTKARGTTRKGKKHSEESKAKMGAAKRKPTQQYTKEGHWLRDWDSATEAGEALGIDRSDIGGCAKGRLKSAGGFVWKYSEE